MTAAQTFAPAMLQEVEPPPLLKLSFMCFCIFNLANYSRFFDWQLSSAHVPMITSTIALMGAAMEGRLAAVFTSKIGMCVTLLTALYTINIPFSTWRSGSLSILTGEWFKTVIVFAIAGALIFNLRQCRTAMHSIGWGTGLGGVLVNWKGEVGIDGRLSFGKGSFRNANEVAFDLLLGLPFLWLILRDPHISKFKKSFAVCLMVANFIGILRSGSRGGLIGFAVMCLLFFLRSSMGAKVGMVMAGVVMLAGALTVLPNSLKVRYATLFSGSSAKAVAENKNELSDVYEAESSSAARRKLLLTSIAVSLSHPLVGVGIGEFAVYEARVDASEGRDSGWQGTHNTYTQISSEAGIPALLVFLCMIVFSVQASQALSKRAKALPPGEQRGAIVDIAFAMSATLVVYAVCVCFDYIAYTATLPTLAGLAIALQRCGKAELDRLEQAPAPVQADPFLNLHPVRTTRAMRPVLLGPARP
jgi:O-antigen ligase